jgi:hypothetical protein
MVEMKENIEDLKFEYDRRVERLERAYTRLSFLHTETMAELVATRERMDAMSASWWWMLKHRIAVKLGMTSRFE